MLRRILISRRAQRDFDALDASTQSAIAAAVAALARDEPNVDVRKLQGYNPPRWRLRVGRYRIVYALEPGILAIERIVDRRDAYR